MQRRTGEIFHQFQSASNLARLEVILERRFDNPAVTAFLKQHTREIASRFARREMMVYNTSAPLPGVSPASELRVLNDQFLEYMVLQIEQNVLIEEAPVFSIGDGMPTSRRGVDHHNMDANSILETWKQNPTRSVQSRGDRAGDNPHNPYHANRDHLVQTGITFCDQSQVGLNQHGGMLMNNSYIRALNTGPGDYTNTAFGNSTAESDARLLSRRTFRSNEAGEENGIPRYEQRLYKRFVERDVDETFAGDSFDYQQRGYDMTSLLNRIDYKNARRQGQAPTPFISY